VEDGSGGGSAGCSGGCCTGADVEGASELLEAAEDVEDDGS